jgi:hypothetical protein
MRDEVQFSRDGRRAHAGRVQCGPWIGCLRREPMLWRRRGRIGLRGRHGLMCHSIAMAVDVTDVDGAPSSMRENDSPIAGCPR